MNGKTWWKSRTVVVNILALVALLVKNLAGFEVSAEESAGILAVVNLILRAVTKEPLKP